jgi:uncharacterized membrane protein YqjE
MTGSLFEDVMVAAMVAGVLTVALTVSLGALVVWAEWRAHRWVRKGGRVHARPPR